jgi:outer membrane immunogenic protein
MGIFMKNSLLGGVALLALLVSVSASYADPYYKPVREMAPRWAGFYAGIETGVGFGTKQFDFNDLTAAAPFRWDSSLTSNGFLAGGQLGYNWQDGWLVIGVEADAMWSSMNGHSICNTTTFFMNCQAKADALGTVTARFGGAVGNALIYGKAGMAWAHDRYTISNVALPPLATAFSSSATSTHMGWTFGMGVEYLIGGHWSAKIEYDYMDFGTDRTDFPVTNPAIAASNYRNWDISQNVHVMKVGINYRFW